MSTVLTPDFFLHHAPPRAAARWVVGFSGGLDSCALLALCAAWRDQAGSDQDVLALHVHHGLSDQADSWLDHCQALCYQLDIPFISRRVEIMPQSRRSTEQLARAARYGVFRDLCKPDDLLLLAHHQDDQVETLLYRLLRGSGVLGLAAMAPFSEARGLAIWRPLLEVPRAELQSFVQTQGLSWVEDPSNQDVRYDRNFLRREVLPLLATRWPEARQTLARSARLAAESAALNDVLAAMDIAAARSSDAQVGSQKASLTISALQCLDRPRLNNVLRFWLRQQGASLPSERVTTQMAAAVRDYHEEHNTLIAWQHAGSEARWQVRTFQGQLWLLKEMAVPGSAWQGSLLQDVNLDLPEGIGVMRLKSGASVPNSAGVELVQQFADQQQCASVVLAKASIQAPLTVRFRRGGERFQPAGRPAKSLKKWLHEWRIPPWERERLPLLFHGDELIWVPGQGAAAGWGAAPDGAGAVTITWYPCSTLLQD